MSLSFSNFIILKNSDILVTKFRGQIFDCPLVHNNSLHPLGTLQNPTQWPRTMSYSEQLFIMRYCSWARFCDYEILNFIYLFNVIIYTIIKLLYSILSQIILLLYSTLLCVHYYTNVIAEYTQEKNIFFIILYFNSFSTCTKHHKVLSYYHIAGYFLNLVKSNLIWIVIS